MAARRLAALALALVLAGLAGCDESGNVADKPGAPSAKPSSAKPAAPKGLAEAAAGVASIGFGEGRTPSPAELIRQLASLPANDLDAMLLGGQASAGLTVWRPGDAEVVHKRILLRRKRGLWFVSGRASMRCARLFDAAEEEELRRLLSRWQSDA